MIKIKDVLDVILKDDNQTTGGISHTTETVEDFIMDTDLKPTDSLEALNRELKLCGIQPVVINKR